MSSVVAVGVARIPRGVTLQKLSQADIVFAFIKSPTLSMISARVVHLDLRDPTAQEPWTEDEWQRFFGAVKDGKSAFQAGLHVVCLCAYGRDRSVRLRDAILAEDEGDVGVCAKTEPLSS